MSGVLKAVGLVLLGFVICFLLVFVIKNLF